MTQIWAPRAPGLKPSGRPRRFKIPRRAIMCVMPEDYLGYARALADHYGLPVGDVLVWKAALGAGLDVPEPILLKVGILPSPEPPPPAGVGGWAAPPQSHLAWFPIHHYEAYSQESRDFCLSLGAVVCVHWSGGAGLPLPQQLRAALPHPGGAHSRTGDLMT